MGRSLGHGGEDHHVVVLDDAAEPSDPPPGAAGCGDQGPTAELERELLDLSVDLISADLDDLDAVIDTILRRVGEARGIDRVLLYRYDWVAQTVSNTHAWASPGVHCFRDELQQVPVAPYGEVIARHRRGELVSIPDRDVLPVDSNFRRLLIAGGVQATISRPLMDGDDCLGAIAFDAVAAPQRWSVEDRRLLRVLSTLLVNVEHRRRHELAAAALHELTSANEALERFAGTVSHDLRSPLASVRGFLDLVRTHKVSEELADELLDRAIGNVDRLTTMVDRLLADARCGGLVTHRAPVALDEVVGVALEQLSARIEARHAVVSVGELSEVEGDAAQLLQLCQNLIGNAIEHAPADRQPHVWISARRGHDHVELIVADNGEGIAPDHHEMALRPFGTVPRGAPQHEPLATGVALGTPVSGGSANGLGLAICERVARAHGGALWLGEAIEGGLAVFVRLPAAASR